MLISNWKKPFSILVYIRPFSALWVEIDTCTFDCQNVNEKKCIFLAGWQYLNEILVLLYRRTCMKCTPVDQNKLIPYWSRFLDLSFSIMSLASRRGYMSQKARDVDPMMVQCWSSVADDGPTLYHLGGMSRVCWGAKNLTKWQDSSDCEIWVDWATVTPLTAGGSGRGVITHKRSPKEQLQIGLSHWTEITMLLPVCNVHGCVQ